MRLIHVLAVLTLGAAACGGDEPCDPIAQTGCAEGLACEVVQGSDEPACFAPLVVRGSVFDLETDAAIGGARVVALDVNRSPVSSVAVSAVDGTYELAIPSVRDGDGVPIAIDLTLRADASGYQTFPGGVRQALPVDTASAVLEEGVWVVSSALTDIGLIQLAEGGGTGSIYGKAEPTSTGAGVLVVAEGPAVGSAIADRHGSFEIFNLPAGAYEVRAYAVGTEYDRADVEVAAERHEVNLAIAGAATATFTGAVQIVNPGSGKATSVIMVVESTFDDVLVRGEAVPGLRAPPPGEAPNISGQFTIEGVPNGNYVILASFENDFLVRDPDTCISGTAILHQTFSGASVDLSSSGFKVTGALDVISPGASGAEAVTGPPVFQWKDDSSEDRYDLVVFDSFGEIIWEKEIPGVSGGNPSVLYEGPELEPGMYYQFRATSSKSSGGSRCELSQTEDLKGVFYLE